MIRKRKNREKNAIHRHCFFNEDESSEDNLIMWLQGRELVKKHGRFISRMAAVVTAGLTLVTVHMTG